VDRRVYQGARAKLLSCLPAPLRASAEDLLRRTSVVVPTSGAEAGIFEQLRGAVADRRRIAIVYSERMSGRVERLEVDPYGLAFRKHAWYMVAHSLKHREVRKFRMSRVTAVEPTALHFGVPKDFSVEEYFQGAWYVFGGRPQEIGLRFSPRVAQLVRERRPHPGQQIQTLSDGTIFYRAVVKNLDEVAWWLVQYGGEATVIHPAELREKVVALASGTLAQYGMTVLRQGPRYPEVESDLDGRVGEQEDEPPIPSG
jgi:proteasome accessory factor B